MSSKRTTALIGTFFALFGFFSCSKPKARTGLMQPEITHGVGRDAIDTLLATHYPDKRDYRMGLQPGPNEERAPLEEVVAYRIENPVPHWHYVSYGLSELGEKVSDDPAHSGFGFELTMRVADESGELLYWPINLMREIARTVWNDRHPLEAGHSFRLPEGMLSKVNPGTAAMGFVLDGALDQIDSPNGQVQFVQMLPLTRDEYDLAGRWDAFELFDQIETQLPQFIWPQQRISLLQGPLGETLNRRAKAEGSSVQVHYTQGLRWNQKQIVLDRFNCEVVGRGLVYRVGYDKPVTFVSEDQALQVRSGRLKFDSDAEGLTTLSIPKDQAIRIGKLLQTDAWMGADLGPFVVVSESQTP